MIRFLGRSTIQFVFLPTRRRQIRFSTQFSIAVQAKQSAMQQVKIDVEHMSNERERTKRRGASTTSY